MGQAKLRKSEISALKAAPKAMTNIIAVRHLVGGKCEFAAFAVVLPKTPTHNKNNLLEFICCMDWLHTPPAGAIAEYLIQTNSFKMTSSYGEMGYVLNFYEPGADPSIPAGQHSCREIGAYPSSKASEMREMYTAKFANEMEIRRY